MNTFESRRNVSQGRRLQGLLALMIVWDVIALLAELSFGGPLLKITGDEIGGILAARGSFSGAALITASIYVYALVRGPLKHRNVVWVGVVQHGAAALFAVYHVATNHVELEGTILPLIVALIFLVLLLINMPRSQPAV
ncbi:MAG: hypothetical protein GEU75_04590 [Dehalococcoidia bacterium]|nr:hypothetical protein [Dehalococcoidia bacterium]